jgi:hypothetical protein
MTQTYSSKSNAKRAAIKEGLEASDYRLVEVPGGWVIEMRGGHREVALVETMEIGARQSDAEVADDAEGEEITNADTAASPDVEATEIEAPKAEQIVTSAKIGKAETDPALIAEAAIIFSVVRPQARHIERLKAAQKAKCPASSIFLRTPTPLTASASPQLKPPSRLAIWPCSKVT